MTPDSSRPVPRDLVGYGAHPPSASWPGGARVALQFVLNYEEGAERCVLDGDPGSEQFLSELSNPPSRPSRHLSMESVFEYGSRVGVWRLLAEFRRRSLPLTVFGVGLALERNPEVAAAIVEAGHELAGHGWRWIDYHDVPEEVERDHIARTVEVITRITGAPPAGWYTGRTSLNTRRLVCDHGGFEYDADSYSDELPYWTRVPRTDGTLISHLVVPYTLDANDMRFALPHGFGQGEDFFVYLRDTFDVLHAEGGVTPRLMSVGMHCRLLGRPGRFRALQRFLDHVERHERVWVCRRVDVARHWRATHPAPRAPGDGSPET